MTSCFLFKHRVCVLYVFPTVPGKWLNYAKRFARLYEKFKPATEHRLLVISNGGTPTPAMQGVFNQVEHEWFVHDNSGWDIGAYQHAARRIDCEVMVCLGASTYLRKAGWLERMVQSAEKYGIGLYGAMGNTGDGRHLVWPHLRTTGFWFQPQLLNAYPFRITHFKQRYEFEHGRTCFCEWVRANGIKPLVVTFDGEYSIEDWNKIRNGYHRGDQSNLLTGDRLTEPPYYHRP